MLVYEIVDDAFTASLYPSNVVRNLARLQVSSSSIIASVLRAMGRGLEIRWHQQLLNAFEITLRACMHHV